MRGNRKTHILVLFFILSGLFAQAQNDTIPKTDTTEAVIIAGIHFQGNRHTKDYVIARDLTFRKGDTLLIKDLNAALDRSQKNIFNTALFNDVKVEAVMLNPGERDIFITVKERWYIIPAPVFQLYDRNYKEWWKTYDHDIRRVTYGVRFSHKNFSGRKDKLDIFLVGGFSKQVLLRYSQPYADRKLRHGFSVAAGYSEKIGESYQILGNTYMPRDTCRDYNGDGVADCGGDTALNYRVFSSRERFISAGYSYRKGLYVTHAAGIGILNKNVADTVVRLNKDFFGSGRTNETFYTISYSYNYSKVDYIPYPLIGQYYTAGIQSRIARHSQSQVLLYAYYGRYFRLFPKFYFATQAAVATRMPAKQSFYNLRSTNLQIGNIRGLEQYAIHGTLEGYLKNTLRFALLDLRLSLPVLKKIRNHEFIPLKVYLKAFGDLAYSHIDFPNTRFLNNKLLRTGGVGIDFVTIYDLTLRIDFSVNQFGQYGVYFK